MAEIILEHVTKKYGEDIALEDVSLKIDKGEFVFVIGKSGAGKTTLLNLLIKKIDATSGHIEVAGDELESMKKRQVPYHRRRLGIMSRDMGLLEELTVYENIRLALRATGRNSKKDRLEIQKALAAVGLLSKAESLPEELSGGEQARILLARALAMKPEILIADEPTANLDADAAWDLMLLFNEINHQGMTLVIASHARELVTVMRKRVITLVAGALVADEKQAIYNPKAVDIFEERRVLRERARKK